MHFSPISDVLENRTSGFQPQPMVERGNQRFGCWAYLSKIIACIRALEYHGLKEHFQFVVAAVLHRGAFQKLAQPDSGGGFAKLMIERPRYVSLLIAPYIDARWSCAVRIDRLIEQAATLRGGLSKYDFSVFESLHLLDLGEFSIPDYNIIIDKPAWFCHEGLLTLNLFKDSFRFFSVTFSFYETDSGINVIIGGLQGRKAHDMLAQYRQFTKLALGMRPRDFLLEVLRMIARAENVQQIVGVPDQFRYHRHSYFTVDSRPDLYLDYDEIWKDRGGVLTPDGWYDLPLRPDRDLAGVAAKKRGMYRRRYALLDRLEARIGLELQIARPRPG